MPSHFTTELIVSKSPGKTPYSYRFTRKEFSTRPKDLLKVSLSENIGDGTKVNILSFCCTDMSKVTAINPTASYPYPPSTQDITLELNLDNQQMISIGIIVRVTDPSGKITDMLCDPQVGNGPP